MKKCVQDLQATPIPVAEDFAELISRGERRNALRDYVLFGLGVVVKHSHRSSVENRRAR
jgi:hypothetical protein